MTCFKKNIFIFVPYVVYLLSLIFCADVIYARFFENIDFLKKPIYLQMAYPVIHRISGIEGLFYELKPNARGGELIEINSLGMRSRETEIKKDRYRIIVMGVRPGSPSAYAFGRLFGDSNVYDLRDQGIDKILKNKDLVKALKGAV